MTAIQMPASPARPQRARIVDRLDAVVPWVYLAYAIPAVIFLSICMAPVQVPDELNHFMRADQVAHGGLVGQSLAPRDSGGIIDVGIRSFGDLYHDMWFHPEVKQTPTLARQAGDMEWTATRERVNFYNTALYGPALYIPQAIGILLGRAAGLSIAQTLILSRLLNGLAACLVGFLALSLCRRGRALTFTTLLLPMTLSQLASASQDALIITLSLLALAIVSRVMAERRPAGTGEFALVAVIVMATTLARTSQIGLVLLSPALIGGRDAGWPWKALIAAAATAPIVLWMFVIDRLMPAWQPGVLVSGQFGISRSMTNIQ